jgi:hypothetical protein
MASSQTMHSVSTSGGETGDGDSLILAYSGVFRYLQKAVVDGRPIRDHRIPTDRSRAQVLKSKPAKPLPIYAMD